MNYVRIKNASDSYDLLRAGKEKSESKFSEMFVRFLERVGGSHSSAVESCCRSASSSLHRRLDVNDLAFRNNAFEYVSLTFFVFCYALLQPVAL